MIRRNFMLGASASAFFGSNAVAQNNDKNQRLDCGLPDSDACKMERETQSRMRERYNNWKNKLGAFEAKIRQDNPQYESSFVALMGKTTKQVVSGGEFDQDFDDRILYYKIVPIEDWNGDKPRKVTALVWRKTGFLKRNKNVAWISGEGSIFVKRRRSYSIGEFSGNCVVLYRKSVIEVESRFEGDYGCWPKESDECKNFPQSGF